MKAVGRVVASAVLGVAVLGATAVGAGAQGGGGGGYGGDFAPYRPAVAGVANGSRTDVFDLDADHGVVHYQLVNHALALREDLGGDILTSPAAVALPDGTEFVFGVGTDNAVWFRQRSGTGPWSGWRSLGGRTTADITAAQSGGVVVLGVQGSDAAMWERTFGPAGWSAGWTHVSSFLVSGPAVGATPTGFAVYAQGRDTRIWTSTRGTGVGGGWGPWHQVADPPSGGDRFAFGVDATAGALLVHGTADAACWQFSAGAWQSLGGRFDVSGFAGITQNGVPAVFGHAPDGVLYTKVGTGAWHRVVS